MTPDDHDTIGIQTMHVGSGQANFPTTRWTLVSAACDQESPNSRVALSALCEAYWFALYVYARRRGDSAEQAQDHRTKWVFRRA